MKARRVSIKCGFEMKSIGTEIRESHLNGIDRNATKGATAVIIIYERVEMREVGTFYGGGIEWSHLGNESTV